MIGTIRSCGGASFLWNSTIHAAIGSRGPCALLAFVPSGWGHSNPLFRGSAGPLRGLQYASGVQCASCGDEPAADIEFALAIGINGHSDDRLHY